LIPYTYTVASTFARPSPAVQRPLSSLPYPAPRSPSMYEPPPFSPTLAQAFSSTLSLQSPPSQPTFAPSLIEALPFELLEKIAAAVCRQTPTGPPTALLSLLVLSRRFYDVLGPRNEGFYSDLFRERFDWRSAERRWAQVCRHLKMSGKRFGAELTPCLTRR
jgi:hypothetical protein